MENGRSMGQAYIANASNRSTFINTWEQTTHHQTFEQSAKDAIELRQRLSVPEIIHEPETLDEYIAYFDNNWQREGLPHDWYTLGNKVGFSMKTQMDLLENTSRDAVIEWKQPTSYLISGFSLEYLSKHVVYPCKYEKDPNDPTKIGDPLYGRVDIVDITSEKERNGSVKETLKKVKSFMLSLDTPIGSMAVMTSPFGESGLATDNGKQVMYPDSYFFVMRKDEDGKDFRITNYTIKTDFTHQECREALFRVTGKSLSPTASLDDYVRLIATIRPGQHDQIRDVEDVVHILENVRETPFVFKDTPWSNVYKEVRQGEKLYEFNGKTKQYKEEFEKWCDTAEYDEKLVYQKALAATILRISKSQLFDEKKVSTAVTLIPNKQYTPVVPATVRYGDVLEAVAAIPGCAGGGQLEQGTQGMYLNTYGGPRKAVVEGSTSETECPEIKCKKCGWRPSEAELRKMDEGKLTSCPGRNGIECGWSPK